MNDDEVLIAGDVHALLLLARPEIDGEELANAAGLASVDESSAASQHDDFRAAAAAAINEVRIAIAAGTGYFERKRLLRHALVSTHSWLNARRFSDQR